MAKRQRVSDQLKTQDMRTAAGLLIAVQALAERYPQSLELKGASRDLADFAKALEEKPAPFVFVPSGEAPSETEHAG